MSWVRVVLLALLVTATTSAEDKRIYIDHWVPVAYPPFAKLAQIEGVVEVTARFNEKGTLDPQQVSGSSVLQTAAVENLKRWTFTCSTCCDSCPSRQGETYRVTYEFRLDHGCSEVDGCFKRNVTFREGRVVVEESLPLVCQCVDELPRPHR